MLKNDFYSRWLINFASDIPEKDIEKYVRTTGNYIWHIFSFDLLDKNQYLVGDAARKAYDKIDKNGAYYIEWFEDEQTQKLTSDLYTAKALDELVEVYVTGKNFEWSYIKTHESDWFGPYFIKRKVKI